VRDPNLFARLGLALALTRNGRDADGRRHLEAVLAQFRKLNVISQIELRLLDEAADVCDMRGQITELLKTRWPGIAEAE
jgi:hypothetical protein